MKKQSIRTSSPGREAQTWRTGWGAALAGCGGAA
jgi:hypothetical protein